MHETKVDQLDNEEVLIINDCRAAPVLFLHLVLTMTRNRTLLKLISGGLVTSGLAYYMLDNKILARNQDKLSQSVSLVSPVTRAAELVERLRLCNQVPGMVVGVTYQGKKLWTQGFGYANIELFAPCHEDTVMRIGSISKAVSTILVAKLVEQGKLDLDKSIYQYVGDKFPRKLIDGKPVDITLRQILSHTSGIRSYKSEAEMYIKHHYDSVFDALKLFTEDDLKHKPGAKFSYSSLAFTLVSAVVESVLPDGKKFEHALIDMLHEDFGMKATFLDENQPIIPNRAAHYEYNQAKKLINAPEIDNSYKWAGGGLISSVSDVLKFGNVMMYSYIGGKDGRTGYFKKTTIDKFWLPHIDSGKANAKAGLGWFVIEARNKSASCNQLLSTNQVYHSGESVGAKANLLIIPEHELVVAMVMNTAQKVDTLELCQNIASFFIEALPAMKSTDQIPALLPAATEPLAASIRA